MTEQRIVVISPFFNAKPYIKRCIDSVAAQSYSNYKHILINDASTDGASEIIYDLLTVKHDSRFNGMNFGAVFNQISAALLADPNDIIMLLDGDDALANNPEIFNFYNHLYSTEEVEFTYGSAWSMVDNIPLIAQEYPPEIKKHRAYRQYRFNWNMPYPHLRTFRRYLLEYIPDSSFQDENGEWYRAGGDNAVFYNLIETAQPERVRAIQDIVYMYNDTNPLNDYKIHTDEQNEVAEKILSRNAKSKTFKFEPLLVDQEEYLKAITPKPYNPNVIIGSNNPVLAGPIEGMDELVEIEREACDRYIRNAERQAPEIDAVEVKFLEDMRAYAFPAIFTKKILIAIPTAKYVESDCFKAIYDLEVPEGYETHFQCFFGNNISQVRNLIADWVIKDYDYLFAVDSDIAFPPDTLKKLLSHDAGIVSGIYMQRKPNEVNLEVYDMWYQRCYWGDLMNKGLVEVGGCGFGCVLVKKEVLVGMGYPQFHWIGDLEHKAMTEDVYFCSKAREKGFKIYADTSIMCSHLGPWRYDLPTMMYEKPFVSFEDGYRDLSKVTSMPIEHFDYLWSLKETTQPKVIYDIGACVLHWTNMAKMVWPDAKYYVCEASPFCEFLYKEQGYPYHLGVLGEKNGDVVDFYCNGNNPGGNGIFKNNPKYIPGVDKLFAEEFRSKMVTSTLDAVAAKNGWPKPDLMKLDVQGSELAILKGATYALTHCKDIIIEMPHVDLQVGAPKKEEIIDYLNLWGFEMVKNFTGNDLDGDYHFRRRTYSLNSDTETTYAIR